MRLGIIGAMRIEVEKLKSQIIELKIETISQIDFYSGKLYGKDVVVAVCGVGKVHAAMCTQIMIMKYSPGIIINTGVAGGISGGVDIGDVVIGTTVMQHDMDTSEVGDPIGMISGINMIDIPCTPSVVEKLAEASKNVENMRVFTGRIATGDQFMRKADALDRVVRLFDAMACDMESGSIGQVCYINNVDYGVVRAISDKGGHSSGIDYGKFLETAANNSITIIKNYLKLV